MVGLKIQHLQKGFTFVELLVVISLIGLIATFILANLNRVREKAYDTRIEGDIKQIRTLAEIYYSNSNTTYTGFDDCVTSPSAASCSTQRLADDMTTITTDLYNVIDPGSLASEVQPTSFCFSAPLRAQAGAYACTDALSSLIITGNACGGGTFKCN